MPGEGDLALGIEEFQRLTTTYDIPVLAGNMACGEVTWPLTRTVLSGGRLVGIIGVVGVPGEGCELTSQPLAAAREGVEELGEVDVVVLISHSQSAVDQTIGREVEGIDFILNGHSRQSWGNPRALDGGGYHLGSGSRGKKLGWLTMSFVESGGAWVDASGTTQLEDEKVRLSDRFDAASAQVRDAVDEDEKARFQTRVDYYQGELDRVEAELVASRSNDDGLSNSFTNQLVPLDEGYDGHEATDSWVESTLDAIAALPATEHSTAPPAGPFKGSQTCRSCHLEQYEQWSSTGHAHAYDTLVKANRHLDNDCFSCHVTGAGMGGPADPHSVGQFKNVGCESCHGPGEEHLADPAKAHIMNPPAKAICTHCHDGVQDAGQFVHEDYLPQVAH